MSYRCLIVVPKQAGILPHFVGVGVGTFGIVNGVVQATGFFTLQSLAGNQIAHIDHIAQLADVLGGFYSFEEVFGLS